ncbi:hypothetical protein V1511DRAFT_455303 [Dipodascopsis uninucleata]
MLGSNGHQQSSFLDSSRSPPSKNLSHVPCKFFRQGTCQAGNTCPFSHSMDSQLEQAPCKYFQKGNCKFGAKCALAHILPDGRRVNHRSLPQNYGPLQLGGRNILPENNSYSNNPSALARSLIAHQRQPPQHSQTQQSHPSQTQSSHSLESEYGLEFNASPPDSTFSQSSHRTLGPLDVPMPASLDSNGISYLARHGPVAASVPAKFGMDAASPPSVPSGDLSSSHALRSLYMSAFGDDLISGPKNFGSKLTGFMSPAADDPTSSSSSSPPGNVTLPFSGQQPRSNNFGATNPIGAPAGRRYVSSSFPARSNIWRGSLPQEEIEVPDVFDSDNFAFEEDFVPSSLNELLTPQERRRRDSRHDEFNQQEFSSSFSARFLSSTPSAIGEGIASSSPKYGESPRFGQLFQQRRKEENHEVPTGSVSVIGSPLRSFTGPQSSNGVESQIFSSSPRSSPLNSISNTSRKLGEFGFVSTQRVQRNPGVRQQQVIEEEETQFVMDEEQLSHHHNRLSDDDVEDDDAAVNSSHVSKNPSNSSNDPSGITHRMEDLFISGRGL